MTDKFILDACCGYRMMWFDKKHPNTIFSDKRLEVNPDVVNDFTELPYKDNTFKLVVWDVPHIIQRDIGKGLIAKSYGTLNPDNWKKDLSKGFKECMRVLDDYGILIFKWGDCDKFANKSRGVDIKMVLSLFNEQALFGHKTRAKMDIKENKQISATYWFCFMKIPKDKNSDNKGVQDK